MAKSLYQVIEETNFEKFIEKQIANAFVIYQQNSGEGMHKYCSKIVRDEIIHLAKIGRKDLAIKYVRLYNQNF